MKKRRAWRGLAAVGLTALIAVALGISGCDGGSPASLADEFTGTWRQLGYQTSWSAPLIVSRGNNGYTATFLYEDAQPTFPMKRRGGALEGTADLAIGKVKIEIRRKPGTDHMLFSNGTTPGGPVGEPIEMVRTSTSTAIPDQE